MQRILASLYNGNIIPWERPNPYSEKQREMLRRLEDEERYFMQKLSPEDGERFQAMSGLQLDLSAAGEEPLFSYAFSLGMLLAMDVMREAETVLGGEAR